VSTVAPRLGWIELETTRHGREEQRHRCCTSLLYWATWAF